ncbi:membrane protein [Bartonella vinsonii]|uniref:Putative membrane protein n=1 Tax=Bartonella vinsonii subsp. berkhoffii str. Tweed TaxID=1094502 RepID=N6VGQ4_BARVB|nr:membrane protein [Bartonella vinsonii]AGF76387.1 putative membrane protein [Bartonella vinsonii subsp. berkhoffii str. Winnie]ENN92935.1 putative membrane protein [Bartonella vinsonii subsp. berkhoffii str. Tweed]
MTSSFIALMGLRFLSWTIIGILITLPVLVLYYLFIKRARLYCKVKKELKHVLKERDSVLEQRAKKEKHNEAGCRVG